MTTILHKRGKGIPEADHFDSVGEILIDTDTGIAYTLTDDGDVVPMGGDEVWSVSDPDEFGIRVAKFSDQVSDSGDPSDFFIRYYTDAAGSTKSRATVNAQSLVGDKVQANSITATDAVEAPEVKAQALEGIATVTGTLVVGDPVEREGEVEVKAPNGTAIAVGPTVGGFPPELSWGATVSMDGTIQAQDYLDADGNSIVSDASNLMSTDSLNQCYAEDWGIIGEGFELRTDGLRTNRFFNHIFQDWYAISSSADPDTHVFRLTAFEGGAAYFNGTVQATDFLDADGNSIIGAGGGGIDWDGENTGGYDFKISLPSGHCFSWGKVKTTFVEAGEFFTQADGFILFNNTVQFNTADSDGNPEGGPPKLQIRSDGIRSWYPIQATDFLDKDGNSIIGAGGGGDPDWADVDYEYTALGYNAAADYQGTALGASAKATSDSAVAIGSDSKGGDSGVAIGTQAIAGDSAIAIGYTANAPSYTFAICDDIRTVDFSSATVQAQGYLDADGNPATVSPSAIVDAFTTLQTAVADEDTVEGIRTALTNALGGLIEKFEGMAK